MAALIKHHIFINYDTYKAHKEESIGWFQYISPTVSLRKNTINRLEKALMVVYMIEEETKGLTKVGEKDSNDAVIIPVFDIYSKKTGKGKGSGSITTNSYEIQCHLYNYNIFKALLARCSNDVNNAFNFNPFGLPQLTTISSYRHQIKVQDNYLASMAIITIHGVKKAQ